MTYQNFNNDMHANFDVMANPIPVITFYRDPPESGILCVQFNKTMRNSKSRLIIRFYTLIGKQKTRKNIAKKTTTKKDCKSTTAK